MDVEYYLKDSIESIECNFAVLKYAEFKVRLSNAFKDYIWRYKPASPIDDFFYFVYLDGILYIFNSYKKGINDGDFKLIFPDAIYMKGTCFFSDAGSISDERLSIYASSLYKQIKK